MAAVAQDEVALQPKVPRRNRLRDKHAPADNSQELQPASTLSSWRWQPGTGADEQHVPQNRHGGIRAQGRMNSTRHRTDTAGVRTVARAWLDWMPPIVITQSCPFSLASAMMNSSLRTCEQGGAFHV